MKVLKLELFQETACYKKPFAMKISETYPLPPYSTISGMMHKILKADEYIPMNISVQGEYESIINNYQTTYFYKQEEVTKMPMNSHLLFNVKLIIHIKAQEEILDKIFNEIVNLDEFLSLGRKEDLVRLDSIKFVNIYELRIDPENEDEEDNVIPYYKLKYPVFIPKSNIIGDINGISYRLNKFYDLKHGLRNWNKVDVLYVESDEMLDRGQVFIDCDNDIIFWS
ncbi:CRISPR-associated protein Cas5t [Alkalithermobacter thermoalcaliphilus JW-YL-7 = DSM 7308]|uniref:CRISPR-associated protein Cas5 family n=1 Tax=Alkalithermobacter thermoalcaliphilus JW-YL-7 = DSM 7308 TaxID=1121328 RepID=A0A150FQT0_CLOPD|nr:CRISPR-associated protein Cas5 family [[Clostridium] paradoxum JW-YL-7 = DSM 7308]SHL29906.1 CRISPR-associated protein Cas5t [[Clostridium] paradoxum JW-YL-7 = DSM 7308]